MLAAAVVAAGVAATGCTVWRLGEARSLARASEPYEQRPANPALAMLVVGDSTAVGTGATTAANSVAGLLGQAHPRLFIANRSRDGARLAEIPVQIAAAQAPPTTGAAWDVVLVSAGGNDVIRGTGPAQLETDFDLALAAARARLRPGGLLVLLPPGNVGNAPFFLQPVAGVMTQRSRVLHAAARAAAQRQDAVYVNLYAESEADPFVRDRGLNAGDGLHPSDAGYRLWHAVLLEQAGLSAVLSAAR